MRLPGVALAGALLGWAGADFVLDGSPVWLLPWALASVAVGLLATSARRAAAEAAVLGFALAYVFMLASYDGPATLTSRLIPFLLLGAFGAVCAAGLATVAAWLAGWWLEPRRDGRRSRSRPAR